MKRVVGLVIYPFWVLYNAIYELSTAKAQCEKRIKRLYQIRTTVPVSITSDPVIINVTDEVLNSIVVDK